MDRFRLIKSFLLADKTSKLLFLESLFFLGWARILISIPFSKVAPSLGTQMKETPNIDILEEIPLLKRISHIIHTMSRHTPWESKCLVRAIAASKMLQRRKVDNTLYLGTAKDDAGKLIAHAWLRSGSKIITGADVMDQFSVIAKFANEYRGDKHGKRSGTS